MTEKFDWDKFRTELFAKLEQLAKIRDDYNDACVNASAFGYFEDAGDGDFDICRTVNIIDPESGIGFSLRCHDWQGIGAEYADNHKNLLDMQVEFSRYVRTLQSIIEVLEYEINIANDINEALTEALAELLEENRK